MIFENSTLKPELGIQKTALKPEFGILKTARSKRNSYVWKQHAQTGIRMYEIIVHDYDFKLMNA